MIELPFVWVPVLLVKRDGGRGEFTHGTTCSEVHSRRRLGSLKRQTIRHEANTLESRARALGVSEFKCNERNRPISVDNKTRQLHRFAAATCHPHPESASNGGWAAVTSLQTPLREVRQTYPQLGRDWVTGKAPDVRDQSHITCGTCIRPSRTLRSVINVPNVCERRKDDNGGRRAREWNGEKGVCFAIRMCLGDWPKDFKPRPSHPVRPPPSPRFYPNSSPPSSPPKHISTSFRLA